MGNAFEFFILITWGFGVLLFWGISFYKLSKQTGGTNLFIKHLAGVLLFLFIACNLILAPAENCEGMLCGLGYALVAMGVFAATTFIWPIILAFVIAERRKPKFAIIKESEEDVLDDNI